MADQMSIEEALSAAQSLKNHFRVFDKIHAVVEYVTQLQGDIPALTKQRDDLAESVRQAKIAAEKEKARYVAEVASACDASQQKLNDLRVEHDRVLAARQDELQQIVAAQGAAKIQLVQMQDEAKAALETLARAYQQKAAEYDAKVREYQKQSAEKMATYDAQVKATAKRLAEAEAQFKDRQAVMETQLQALVATKDALLEDIAKLKNKFAAV